MSAEPRQAGNLDSLTGALARQFPCDLRDIRVIIAVTGDCESGELSRLVKVETMSRAGKGSAEGRTVDETRIVMSRIMQPPDANSWGNVHGGAIMRLVDEAGGAVAIRHSRSQSVTVAMDRMIFKQPVHIGDLLTIRACLTYTGHTSMEVQAVIEAENMRTGEIRHAGTCYLVYVALDDAGRPIPVPPLIVRTDEERARWRAAERRRAARAAQEAVEDTEDTEDTEEGAPA